MIIRAATARPMEPAIARRNGRLIDAGDARAHQTVFVELPVLIAVAAIPLAHVIVPLVGKPHRNAVVAKGPDFLDQPVVELPVPLAAQECLDCRAALEKFRAIAPATVR